MATPIKTKSGQKNVAYPALRDKSKIYLPPLHIEIGLKKISAKFTDKSIEGFGY
jgi:hypothetical protein